MIEGTGLPGRSFCAGPDAPDFRNVHLALRSTSKDRPSLVTPGHPWQATEPVPGNAPSAQWEVPITVRCRADGLNFGGPSAEGTFRLFRGSKLQLAEVDPALIGRAMRPGSRLVARIRFTGAAEGPNPVWSVEHS